ncbi:UDP-N-acetylmuramoyl-tripeptide--D-alanyl-D-alanine ligase [Nocardioides sp. zg-DK7169]|uniref:Mur ligase family protein n=1 Tax=Nocardioides sp. zg-DK7169 TaxID=2736600 RepID=UPI001555454E|nr:UDP-N-acetylmuramoyl-tripeptide--D-alanyl-D-alanine ligase [Nocardioides sp. zg-DK7169]NPC95585.1 UDP-N-acetylmuramoyl-tripeptide--D-alanyl-D-alanine ligase [Nocardioides sp. zg-DK7169]
MSTLEILCTVGVTLLVLLSQLRWLRVAQREHYEPGRLFAIAAIWARAGWINTLGLVGVVAGTVLAVDPLSAWTVLLPALFWFAWPEGLAVWPSSSRVVFTDRVKRLAAVIVVLELVLAAGLTAVGLIGLLPILALPVAELAQLITAPVERAMGRKYQVAAAAKMRKLDPRVVAITGSYGKTSTKNYAAHLMSGRWATLASPASFNNAMGLSRAVNDRLEGGTDVFVAEMGTYGPGEIAALCEVFRPEVSAITTIGEAHLERMKNRETIVRAKSEILPPASTVVLNVDVPELAAIADEMAATKRVIRASGGETPDADVVVRRAGDGWEVVLSGAVHRVDLPAEVGHPINVAVAIGLAQAVDVPEQTILDRLPGIPSTPHRAEATRTETGLTVIDDTYNSNPQGAAQALARARELVGEGGTVWTITPGMVELGASQHERNADLARAATADDGMILCVVGRTNRAALDSGTAGRTRHFATREEAAQHVMAQAGPDDVVLYENDLPNHYP